MRLAHKDVALALELAEKMRRADAHRPHRAATSSTRRMQRGWGERDCRVAMTLQEERAEVSARVAPERLKDALKD